MTQTQDGEPNEADQKRDNLVRRALATPPISNEDILKRSKESRGAKAHGK